MAIEFTCDNCGQNIVIGEAGAALIVQRLKCGRQLDVPNLESKESKTRIQTWAIFAGCLVSALCVAAPPDTNTVAANPTSSRVTYLALFSSRAYDIAAPLTVR